MTRKKESASTPRKAATKQADSAARPARSNGARSNGKSRSSSWRPGDWATGGVAAASAGAVAAIAAGGWLLWNRWRASDPAHPAAFADGEHEPDNFVQHRNAGPVGMRDDPGRDWDAVDQASDESFPASDPPSTY